MSAGVGPPPIFLGLLALTAAAGAAAWQAGTQVRPVAYAAVFALVVTGWLVSLCLHEFAHAYTAWRFGDDSAAARGYLTLNPLRYSHPLLSLGLPMLIVAFGGIGLPGGAVYLQTARMSPAQRSLVSLAGPAANLVLGVALLTATRLVGTAGHTVFFSAVAFLGFLQITAVALNLLPVPGLDGYGVVEPHLSQATRDKLEPLNKWGLLVLLVLLLSTPVNRWFFAAVFRFFDLFGVPQKLVLWGLTLTQFWNAWR